MIFGSRAGVDRCAGEWVLTGLVLRLGLALATACCAVAAGAPSCSTCHPKEASRYALSAMGQSLVAPGVLPDGTIMHAASGSTITTSWREGRMMHSLSERGYTAEYAVRYQIGGKLMGRSYMVQAGDYLLESPASWFNRYGWDVSPGYAHMAVLDFDRPMEEQCLFCHAGNARFADSDGRRLRSTNLSAITCERCHGLGEGHALHPSARNIVNPAALTGAKRDSVCEQCHLEGANRVLNPGKNWNDFQAGGTTEQVFATFVIRGGAGRDRKAVSQAEQLAQSRCLRESGGKLWCGSCHDPHGAEVADRGKQMRSVCLSCHGNLTGAAHPAAGDAPPGECTSCHMPSSATTDIPHAAITDHRLLRRPAEATGDSGPEKVVAWREPAEAVRERDLSLAEIVIGYTKNLPAAGQEGLSRLNALPEAIRENDPTVLSYQEGLALQQQQFPEAIRLGRRLTELQPKSAKAAMNLGLVLKRSGDGVEAEAQLTRAIELDPSLKQAYMELTTLYAARQEREKAAGVMDRYLKWNPQDILFRLQRARLGSQP